MFFYAPLHIKEGKGERAEGLSLLSMSVSEPVNTSQHTLLVNIETDNIVNTVLSLALVYPDSRFLDFQLFLLQENLPNNMHHIWENSQLIKAKSYSIMDYSGSFEGYG